MGVFNKIKLIIVVLSNIIMSLYLEPIILNIYAKILKTKLKILVIYSFYKDSQRAYSFSSLNSQVFIVL